MNILVLTNNRFYNYFEKIKSDKLGFYFSFFLHLIILLFAIGIPNFFDPKPINIPTIIPIEIINISDTTSIPKKVKDTKSAANKTVKVKEKKFNSSNNQELKKIEIKDKPIVDDNKIKKKILLKSDSAVKEKEQIQIELNKQKIQVDTNNIESLPTKKIKPKMKPQMKPKTTNQKNLDLSIEVKSKPKLKEESIVASVLKDLRNKKIEKKIESDNDEKKEEILEQPNKKDSQEIAKLSISEVDLLRQQLSKCWIAPAGVEMKQDTLVKISAKLKQNGRIYENSIRIVDTNISKSNTFYGPITESAMRTLLNPECIPLKLPVEKYDSWKKLTITFDHSIMKGY